MSNVIYLRALEFEVDVDEPQATFSTALTESVTKLCQAAAQQWARENGGPGSLSRVALCRVRVRTSEALMAVLSAPDAFDIILKYDDDSEAEE